PGVSTGPPARCLVRGRWTSGAGAVDCRVRPRTGDSSAGDLAGHAPRPQCAPARSVPGRADGVYRAWLKSPVRGADEGWRGEYPVTEATLRIKCPSLSCRKILA